MSGLMPNGGSRNAMATTRWQRLEAGRVLHNRRVLVICLDCKVDSRKSGNGSWGLMMPGVEEG